MPIDFNTNFWINKPFIPPIIQQQTIRGNLLSQDIFEKTITNTDSNYDGIKIEKKFFGKIKKTGKDAYLYTISNKNGASVDISSYGATITSIKIPDKNGKIIDVAQGYNTLTPYEESSIGHAGGTIGPCANRIDKGKFKLDNKEYQLECNKGNVHSHGGKEGFDRKNWEAEILKDGIKFTYLKKDMENGYPGNVTARVIYKLDNKNQLHIIYEAETDKDTILNLTNHSYFNLNGTENAEAGSIKNHIVQLPNSTKYTPVDGNGIPTGEMANVENTIFDFRTPKKLSEMNPDGYDQNYCIDGYDGKSMILAAKVKSDKINMDVITNLPGFQFYTANNLGKTEQPFGKEGKRYEKHSALCIEPQFFPNAINSFDEKPILRKGNQYRREIIYSFYN